MQSWAAEEFSGMDLGDKRLNRRLVRIVERLAHHPAVSVPAACKNWAETKAVYRFWDAEGVAAGEIRAAHREKTLERMHGQEWILIAQDTTELRYTSHESMEGLGYASRVGSKGVFVHSGLAIQLDGVPLGLVYQEIWARPIDELGKGDQRRKRPTSSKESRRWIDTLKACQTAVPPETHMVLIADREADMYDLFAEKCQSGRYLLVRSAHNRKIEHGGGDLLWKTVQSLAAAGQMEVEVGRQGDRPPRRALLEIRFVELSILPPHQGKRRIGPKPIPVRVVLAQELDPPEQEEGICWWLLTTLPVISLDDAIRCVRWYSYRWFIERYHFVLKSGCQIEKLQLGTVERLERALATYAIVAWRLLWLTYQARKHGEEPCDTVLEAHEWQSLYCTTFHTRQYPPQPPSLKLAVLWIAQLGGSLARKGDGDPGAKTIWRGLRRLSDISATWLLLTENQSPRSGDVGNG